ncbi:MAG: 3-isopropylmalate dehydratase large subunit [Chloroflexota bacterium]|nr:MAG: 3-isopropylmalate dehydratase large subunit [Chloroflexota bacterium]
MNQTIAEKIISSHSGRTVTAGEIAIVNVDGAMATDATAPFAIQAFEKMGGQRLWDPDRVSLVIDHAAPAPNERVGNLHQMMRVFSEQFGCRLYDVGQGICHQLMVENRHVRPGEIFVGADSHTPTYGALGALAVGVGSTDLAAVLLTGQIWLKVPETIRIELDGEFPKGVTAKDLILFLVGQLGLSGATYKIVEFSGQALHDLSLASRMTIANMSAEMGAKSGLVDPTNLSLPYPFVPVFPDDGAQYSAQYRFDVSALQPQVAAPHSPDQVSAVAEVAGKAVDQAFIGSCTNARLEDLRMAARILKGKKLHPRVRLIIAPASKRIFDAALEDGTAATLSAAGAVFITSGCGPCVGTHQGVPGDGEVIISSTNRNFRGRMGNRNAAVYLGSPAVVAASALQGQIADPVQLLAGEDMEWEL